MKKMSYVCGRKIHEYLTLNLNILIVRGNNNKKLRT